MSVGLAVVGGGILGCFTAHLAAAAGRDVLLVERSSVGAGATGWSAGVSFPLAATDAHRDLVRVSRSGYDRLLDTPAARFLRPVRMVYVVGPGTVPRVVDAPLRPVDAAERAAVERMLPGVRIGDGERVLTHDGHGFVVDARGLAQWLVSGPVTVELGHHVTTVEPDGTGFLVVGDRARWRAERVVVATGPWPDPAGGAPVRTKRVAALHAEIPAEPGDPLVNFVDDDLFVLPTGAGAALVSFYRDTWDIDPGTLTGQADIADVLAGTAALRLRCPAAADAVTGGRAFCDGYAADRLPQVAERGGVVSIHGGSGSGVRLAPALAATALAATALRAAGAPTGRTTAAAPVAAAR